MAKQIKNNGLNSVLEVINESAAFNVTDFKPGAEVKVGNKIGTIVSNLPNDNDEISIDFDGKVKWIDIDKVMLNESDSTDVTDTGNETVIVSDSDKPLPVQLATEFVNLTDKEITFENWIQSKALDNDAIDNKTIVETKTALAKLQTEQVLNESAQLAAKFVNESANMLNESAEIALIKQHIPASHSYMVSQLNESALFVLEQQAKMYSVNESNIYDFIESRDWQAIANSSINESAAINSINNNISATNFSNKLMQSLRAGK
jgi:hypothetical protein